ncbi:MAG: rane dipeptidase [Cohnella sp.]|nr:rane dipeptidase [Cohnella sp.]
MDVADLHCDVVCKMLEYPGVSLLKPDDRLDVSVERLRQGGVSLQVFALFLPEVLPRIPENMFRAVELYFSGVLSHPDILPVHSASDVEAARQTGKIGAVFSIEGVDALQGNLWVLRLLHRMGVRLLGPTWNQANWACDGAMEPRKGGLTKAGRRLVAECEALGILVDVSHLSDRGFWDLAETAHRPFFASHSNARALTPHARNLTDDQIRALIAVDGVIGITFVPWFLTDREPAQISDVLRHVEHVCALGGERHLAFGSDYDGTSRLPEGLVHPGNYPKLIDALLKRYPEEWVRGFASGNVRRFFAKNLLN